MHWQLTDKARKRLQGETGTVVKDWGGRLSVALVFPNSYYVGMSNLGFQTIYGALNRRPEIVCERAFLPDPEDLPVHERSGVPVLSLESQRPLREFDCVAFSATYENDYLHMLQILALSGIPVRARDRAEGDPLVSMGGVCAWSNPEPLAAFMDWFFLGEGEESGPEVFGLWREVREAERDPIAARDAFFRALGRIEGVYVPHLYEVRYQRGWNRGRGCCAGRGAPARPQATARSAGRPRHDLRDSHGGHRVRAHGSRRGGQGVRSGLPVLHGGGDLPSRPASAPTCHPAGRRCRA